MFNRSARFFGGHVDVRDDPISDSDLQPLSHSLLIPKSRVEAIWQPDSPIAPPRQSLCPTIMEG